MLSCQSVVAGCQEPAKPLADEQTFCVHPPSSKGLDRTGSTQVLRIRGILGSNQTACRLPISLPLLILSSIAKCCVILVVAHISKDFAADHPLIQLFSVLSFPGMMMEFVCMMSHFQTMRWPLEVAPLGQETSALVVVSLVAKQPQLSLSTSSGPLPLSPVML